MINLNHYRTALLVVTASLFSWGSAQAQTGPSTLIVSPDGSSGSVATLADEPAAPPATLYLSQPPAPETTQAFYDGSHKDLHHSLAWMQETNAVAPTYWNLYTEARIRLQLHDYTGASSTAAQAYKLAVKSMPASKQYVALSAAVVAKAHELGER